MSENPFKRPDESGFLDNDPFAELMRMADAPRPKAEEPSFSGNESFDIDLERELLGDFNDEPQSEAPQSTVADHWSRYPEPHDAGGAPAFAETMPGDDAVFASDRAAEPADEFDALDFSLDLDMTEEEPLLPLSTTDEFIVPAAAVDEKIIPDDFDARSHALFAAVPERADAPVSDDHARSDEFDQAFADFDFPDASGSRNSDELVADPIVFADFTESGDDGFAVPATPVFEDDAIAEPFGFDNFDVDGELDALPFERSLQVPETHSDFDDGVVSVESPVGTAYTPNADAASADDFDLDFDFTDDIEPELPADPIFGTETPQPATQTFAHDDVLQAGPASDDAVADPFVAFDAPSTDPREQVVDTAWSPVDLQPEGPVEQVPPSIVAAPVLAARQWAGEPQLRRDVADDDDVLGDIESWLNADPDPADDAHDRFIPAAHIEAVPAAQAFNTPTSVPQAQPEPQPLSLEDELSALLGNDEAQSAPALAVVAPAAHRATEPFFDDASIAQPSDDDFDISLDLDFEESDLAAHDPAMNDDFGAVPLPIDAADPVDLDAVDGSDDWMAQPASAASGTLIEEPVAPRKAGPLAMLAALAPAAIARFGGSERAALSRVSEPLQPATPLFGMARANRPVSPDIETVEVDEQPIAYVDDLDIPDLARSEDAAPFFSPDDLEAELDVAFGSLAPDELQPAASAPGAPAELEAGIPAQGNAVDAELAFAQEPYTTTADQDFGDVAFDYDPDAEDPDQPPSPPKDGLRRKYFILGGVAVIAIVGGLGFFMTGGPGSSGVPVVVRADPEPFRVRPENRGGATVPNQNSQAYQRATGATGEPGGGQAELLTSAEELLDVQSAVTPVDTSDDFPMVGMETIPMLDEAQASEMLASVKSDERLGSIDDIIEQDSIEIAPRRVRTMVVRADGTLVAREDMPAAPTREQLEAAALSGATGEGTAVPLVQDAQPGGTIAPPVATDIQPGDPVMPDAVDVVPTRPQASLTSEAPVLIAAAGPSATTPVAQSASVAAPAIGEWSMQIASQPTAEGAQSSYQDLARRYGSVLEGKGVNIVRADIDGMGTFYRVRIPATTRDEAIQLCESFKAAGGSCFVSR